MISLSAIRNAATEDFISTEPLPKIRSFLISPLNGSLSHKLSSPGGTTSTCPLKASVLLKPDFGDHRAKRFVTPWVEETLVWKPNCSTNEEINSRDPPSSGVIDLKLISFFVNAIGSSINLVMISLVINHL